MSEDGMTGFGGSKMQKKMGKIELSALTKEDIGRWVIYDDGFKREKGRIKSWNEEFIFVVYKCNEEWERFPDFTGCATNPEDLRFTTLEEII